LAEKIYKYKVYIDRGMTAGIVSTYTIKCISPLNLFFYVFPVEYKYDDVSVIFF